jgi:hypothetical protein
MPAAHIPFRLQRRSYESICRDRREENAGGPTLIHIGRDQPGAAVIDRLRPTAIASPAEHSGPLPAQESHCLQQQRSDGEVQAGSAYAPTVALLDPIHFSWTGANAVRSQPGFVLAIGNGHSTAANSADDQSL